MFGIKKHMTLQLQTIITGIYNQAVGMWKDTTESVPDVTIALFW